MERNLVSGGMLKVLWHNRASAGYVDLLPLDWFSKRNVPSLEHDILGPRGDVSRARCSLVARGKVVELDYGGKHRKFNDDEVFIGQLKIQFADTRRREPVKVWWRDEGKAYTPAPARWWVDGESDLEALEGGPKLVAHLRRERSIHLRNSKIEEVLREKRKLLCEVCNFSFENKYGKIGKGFCEVHHRVGLAKSGKVAVKTKDLAILCANCHRMIHRTSPMLSVEKFESELRRAGIDSKGLDPGKV